MDVARIKSSIRDLQIACYPDPSLSSAIEPLGYRYPWQIYTRWQGLQLSARLPGSYPVATLRAELDAILQAYSPAQQFGQYHLGGWTGVALHAVDGNPLEDRDIPGAVFAKTAAIKLAPTMERILDELPGEKRRVRLLQLAPGRKVFWHRDFWHSVDSTLLRLHIPIVTNDLVAFQISHQDCQWQPGELWYGDFTFPHRLQNGGTEARIHLVIDLANTAEVRALLPGLIHQQHADRMRARKLCNGMLSAWNAVFATEQRLARLRRQRTV